MMKRNQKATQSNPRKKLQRKSTRQEKTVETHIDESVALEQPSSSAPIIEDDVEKFIDLLQNKSPIPQASTGRKQKQVLRQGTIVNYIKPMRDWKVSINICCFEYI
ncbi:unnamed protein product [Mucor fragilis]